MKNQIKKLQKTANRTVAKGIKNTTQKKKVCIKTLGSKYGTYNI